MSYIPDGFASEDIKPCSLRLYMQTLHPHFEKISKINPIKTTKAVTDDRTIIMTIFLLESFLLPLGTSTPKGFIGPSSFVLTG